MLAAALATPAAPLAAQVNLPALGDAGAEDLSVGQERRLGEQIMREVFRDPAYLDDPVLLEYVQSIWRPLVAEARRRGDIEPGVDRQLSWDTFLVRDRSVNAFALPGGWVGVHLGLISLTGSADELASVMAHELSHVSQRHIARSVGNAQRVSLLGLGAMILGILAAGRSSNPDVASAAIAGGQAAAQQGQLNFSRDMEREADRIGFGLLRGAGFDPRGMSAMFEKLDAANRINDGSAFPYLRSHPLTVERTSEARSRTLLEAGGPPGSTLLHALMQARARVLMD
ncbi:MAG TPA: M48 family metalloprotease, partial [Rubrivivax sp.]|nr:M48 family metalloprotease [Rubrivivax sp.]